MIIKTQVAQTAAGWLHRKWKVQPLVSFTAADSDISRHFNDRIDPKGYTNCWGGNSNNWWR